MKEYSVLNISFLDFIRYKTLIILGTNNKDCFSALYSGLLQVGYKGSIFLFAHKNMAFELGFVEKADRFFVSIEGKYDERLVPLICDKSLGETCVIFFSPDPFSEKNDNILEIAAMVKQRQHIDLVTLETGGKRLFKFLNPINSYKNTDLFLQKKYYSDRKHDYHFDDRRKHRKNVCMVLAGYKEELYNIVFSRLRRFAPKDIDICLITSGKYSERVDVVAKENDWSYLYTRENNVSLAQNLAIDLHPDAEGIYKIDEDIFVTKYFFDTLRNTYDKLLKEADFYPGPIAPLIPVHGYGSIRVLEKTNLMKAYSSFLGKETLPRMAGEIFSSPEAALFMWGADGSMPHIDTLNIRFHENAFSYTLCPIIFSIGSIYFRREFWQNMGGFYIQKYGSSMGEDEKQLCTYAMRRERPIVVSENTLVGHLAFGPQSEIMMKYFHEHRERFEIIEDENY